MVSVPWEEDLGMKLVRQMVRSIGHLSKRAFVISGSVSLTTVLIAGGFVPAHGNALNVTFPTGSLAFSINSFQSVATATGVTPAITGGAGGTVRVTVSASNSGLVRITSTTGITASAPYTSSNLTDGLATISFQGTVANVSNALGTLQFRRNSAGSSTITVDATEGTGLVFGNNYYEVVSTVNGIVWQAAFNDALTRSIPANDGGPACQGYLATITSADEQTFAFDRVRAESWIALADEVTAVNNAITAYNEDNNPDLSTFANQTAAEGKFFWVAGPERGQQVTTGNSTGGAAPLVAGAYGNWNNGEPNNSGFEHATQMLGTSSQGRWNDLPHDRDFGIRTYIVEYGGVRVAAGKALGSKEACVPAAVTGTTTRSFTALAATAPGQPNAPTALAGIQQVSLSWSAPNSDGGAPITGYRIDISSNNGSSYTTVVANSGSSATSAVVPNLVPGTSYVFRIFAINGIGASTGSNASTAVTVLAGAPGTPVNIQVSYPTSTLVLISWDPPSSDGGSAITSYVVEYQNGGAWIALTPSGRTASTSAVTINDGWQLRIAAVNAVGQSGYATWQNQPPQPYSGPIITGFSSRNLVTQESSTVTFTGSRLSLVTELYIGSTKLTFTKNNLDQLVVNLPALAAGTYDLRIIYGVGNLTHLSAFTVKDRAPEPLKQTSLNFTNFAGNGARLTTAARAGIESGIRQFNQVQKITCTGSTSANRITTAERRLALRRAQEACNFAKTLAPNAEIELIANPASGVGARFRSVSVVIEGK